MNWLLRLIGWHDKKQEERTQEVADYVHGKKNEFASQMANLHNDWKEVHKQDTLAVRSSLELNKSVSDISQQIAQATGGLFRTKRYAK